MASWGHCHTRGAGQAQEMRQEEPHAALQRESPLLLLGRNHPKHQYRLGGKQLPREGPGRQAVHEPVMCPYGKGGQQPYALIWLKGAELLHELVKN